MNDINVREAMESQTAPIRKRVSQFVQGNDPAVHRARANFVEDLKYELKHHLLNSDRSGMPNELAEGYEEVFKMMDAIIHAERVYGDE